jgi:hypothetical protein
MGKRLLKVVRAAAPALIRDAAGLVGAGSIAYGAGLVYLPAGFIVGGLLALVGSLLATRGAGRKDER